MGRTERITVSIAGLVDLIKLHPRGMPPAAQNEFVTHVCRHMHAIDKLGLQKRPKHHFTIELAARYG